MEFLLRRTSVNKTLNLPLRIGQDHVRGVKRSGMRTQIMIYILILWFIIIKYHWHMSVI